ncbi:MULTISPECIES: hypothetical protein [Acinetobacter]|uniref:Uncharacterized protein n=1 Tax=Acinetobacter junii CIP 107470 = MTCC 11364 TaxID=1217666 RepID=S7WDX1_ACIJU|nr:MULTISPECIES: hypothetical protein [Acinetobacter]ENV52244.1 hypothetical protein F953_00323 [Acinetobacter junii CIP 107470 = MTCC 11364]EPR81206.1 hypothetical protein L292_1239 [Acinetobacter junii CIP 107470 = MTCC 11364]NAR77707.1 hypothetical protein [Acinetobacter haemolyticus]NAR90242.1 hypothetical protein [Acinetobacter haemolyticus]RSN74987.1 hypothetical protein EA769_11040 [Acinetobacter haemolyticus]
MNGYSYLEDTQELKLEPFRDFYKKLAKAKLENYQDSIKLNDFIKPTEIIELKNIITQKLADKSISEYPLVHYLISVIHTPSTYQANALKWAIFNTTCIELLDSKEHAATVANLCMRFRLASKKQEYHWLYNSLPTLPIELEDLLEFLNKEETKNRELLNRSTPELDEKRIGQLANLRVIYQYVFTQSERLKRNRQSSSGAKEAPQTDVQKISRISLDDEQTYQTHFEQGTAKQPREDKTIEKVEDHNFEFNPLEQYSTTAQVNNLKNKVLHQNKNQLMSKSNPRVFDLPTAQYIMRILFEQAETSPIHALLLFSVLSLTHYKELLVFRKNFRLSSKRKEITFSPENFYFRQSFDNSKFKDALLKEYMMNIGNSFTIPLPKVYFDQIFKLKKWDKADIASDVQEYLRRISDGLTFHLTARNLPRLISDITLNELGYELESKLLSGENVNSYTPSHYYSMKIVDILDIYSQTLYLVCPQLDTSYIEEFKSPVTFGSQQTPDLPLVKSFFKELDKQVRGNPNPFNTLKYYSIWLWYVCMIMTSARPNEAFPPNLDYLDLDNCLLAVADKEQRYSGTIGRYLPFNNFLRDEIQSYLNYLKQFQHLMKACANQVKTALIQEIFDGQCPFLVYPKTEGYIRNLELADIEKNSPTIVLQRNWTRHFARYFFAQHCDEDMLNGIFGHDGPMQELFDRYSGFQATDYDHIRAAQDKLVELLKLKSMSTFNGFLIE